RAELRENLALDRLVLGRGLDDDVVVGEAFQRRRGLDARQAFLPALLVELLGGNLAGHVAADRGDARLDAFFRHIIEADAVSRDRGDMGYAAAHLPGADDAHFRNLARHR